MCDYWMEPIPNWRIRSCQIPCRPLGRRLSFEWARLCCLSRFRIVKFPFRPIIAGIRSLLYLGSALRWPRRLGPTGSAISATGRYPSAQCDSPLPSTHCGSTHTGIWWYHITSSATGYRCWGVDTAPYPNFPTLGGNPRIGSPTGFTSPASEGVFRVARGRRFEYDLGPKPTVPRSDPGVVVRYHIRKVTRM